MSNQDYDGNYCKRCYTKVHKLSNKEVGRIVMTEYQDKCDRCGNETKLVAYVEDYDD